MGRARYIKRYAETEETMSVLKNERKESKFEVFHQAYKLRKDLTDFLLRDFGYRKLDKPCENEKQQIRREAFEEWFIVDERKYVLNLLRSLLRNITVANNIFPTNLAELEERRLLQDKAVGDCYNILQELQYTIETLPVDVNKYTRFALQLEKVINLIKAWRKSDNRFKKQIK